ncbi:MAG: LPS-assembly protein LptD, partial [Parvularculaceae bacterium]|nr:LPS-assembly protein LptD [Parvularculaceae bacterium]
YFRQYNVVRSGDLRREIDTVSTLRLRSNINAVWKSGGSVLRVDSFLFQGLRSTDNSRLTPYVLPVVDFRHTFDQTVAGGEVSLGANFASLQRTGGADTRRLSVDATWSRDIVTPGGHKIDLLANMRGDAFRYADLDEGTETVAANPALRKDRIYRFTPTLSAGWSYPLTRRVPGAQLLVEPKAQIVASLADKNPAGILNEDSQSVEFDFAGLFEYNKAPGFDRLEDGQRFNVGLIASAAFDNGLSIEGSAGRQWRVQPTRAFNPGSGLGNKRSDIVGELNIRYKDNIALENRFRFDEATRDLTRAESQLLFNAWRFSGLINYVRLNDENPVVELARREEVSGNMRFRLNRNWSLTAGTRRNLVTKQFINQDFTLGYNDECSTFEILYRRDLTRDVGLPADNAVLVRFTLRGLVD